MGLFATKTRAGHTDGPGAGAGAVRKPVRQTLPDRFVAVGEALASGSGSVESCDIAGRSLAQDGASLDEVLQGLRATAQLVSGADPAFADVQAIATAWSEATLAYLHRLSCEDPLTGLASPPTCAAGCRRSTAASTTPTAPCRTPTRWWCSSCPEDRPGDRVDSDQFSRSLRLARLGETARTVFPGSETIGRLGQPSRARARPARRPAGTAYVAAAHDAAARAVPHPALDRGASCHRRLRGDPARRAGPRLTLPGPLSVPPTRLAACAAAMPPLAVPRT